MDEEPTDGRRPEGTVVTRIDPDSETAEYDLLELVAELERVDIETLPPLYNEVDHLVEQLFQTPPAKRAQVSLSFSYAGYRITLRQNGTVELVPVKRSLDP